MFLLPFFCSFSTVIAASSLAGVNIAGFDFGTDITGTTNLANVFPPLVESGGSDGAGQMQHFSKEDGLNSFRLPVSWQFLINNNNTVGMSLNSNSTTSPANGTIPGNSTRNAVAGVLHATNFAAYDQLVQACLATGAHCIIDIHNYARFNNLIIGQGGPTNAQFADLWAQIAAKYANQTNIIFGIMNEPHDVDIVLWAATVQEAVSAIRKAGATTQMILLPGNDFTGAQTFISNGSAGNLSTVKNPDGTTTNLIFDVHKYLDVDGSGTHQECVSNHIEDTFVPLTAFLEANKRTAILSEIGGGNSTSCLNDLCQTLMYINGNPDSYLGYNGWGAGGFSPTTYVLTMTPFTTSSGNGTKFTDQLIVSQCVVGTHNGGGIASKHKRTIRR